MVTGSNWLMALATAAYWALAGLACEESWEQRCERVRGRQKVGRQFNLRVLSQPLQCIAMGMLQLGMLHCIAYAWRCSKHLASQW